MRVAVVGGGLAGIAAALRCADAGAEVVLLEAKPRLGGLTHSFRRDGHWVDNGQHVFLRCCVDYLALLERLGVADRVELQPRLDIPVRRPGRAAPYRLRRNRLPAPLHLSGSILRYGALSWPERLRFGTAALALRRVDRNAPASDAQSFGAWLAAHGQSRRAIDALWDLVGIATLNAPAERASLALAATVFQLGLLTEASAGDVGWSRVPLQELHGDAAAERLGAAGARVLCGRKAYRLRAEGAGWLVGCREGETVVDRVVLAVPPTEAARLLPAGGVPLPQGWAEGLGSSPIVNVHVWFDRAVLDGPFSAGVDSPVQWVFDRTMQAGVHSGQYIAVSLSAAVDWIDLPTARVRERILPALLELLPAARSAAVLDFFVTRERHATFAPAPGTAAMRPGPVTGVPGVFLAGAWTDTGWPATMEGAARSGNAAAAALLSHPAPTGTAVAR
jgi:hydroxysqualene dehydroxylase